MTVNLIRSRQRHKTISGIGEKELEEFQEYLPSTSSCQHHPEQTSTDPEEDESMMTTRIASFRDDETVVDSDEKCSMRRREFRRTRRRKEEPTSSSTAATSTISSLLRFRTLLLTLALCTFFQIAHSEDNVTEIILSQNDSFVEDSKNVTAEPELRCGPVDIRNRPGHFRQQWSRLGDPNAINFYNKSVVDCTVVEGSFSISFIYQPTDSSLPRIRPDMYPRFPKLKEITGTLLVFETNAIKSLRDIFPNLRVIGGQSLIQHFSLIIYRNSDLEILGLDRLTVIRNGGVRIQDNKMLCYPNTINWKDKIQGPINDVIVDNAAEMSVTETGKLCQNGCVEDQDRSKCYYLKTSTHGAPIQSCWNDTTCDRRCAWDRVDGKFGPGCDIDGNKCHDECIGGCDKRDDAYKCSACKNFHYQGKCVSKCPSHMYVLMDRRCVTKAECLALNPFHKNISVPIKATAGLCSDRCPNGYEIDKNDNKKCKKCDGECVITCPINHVIDSFPKAKALERCNIIEGNLTIEMRGKQDSGMAAELKTMFANIQVITGYLSIQRTTPFLSLGMFKNLKRIEAKSLHLGKYALVVVENQNLRKLFESNTNFTIGRGTIMFHNNRMLCFKYVKDLLDQLKLFKNHSEDDQSPQSNGDKAICQDVVIKVNLTEVASNSIELAWPGFNTSDMDHRKFLGYEVYWKPVTEVDEKMSIDDDRSACVDTWSSKFIEHREREDFQPAEKISIKIGTDDRIQPNTIYAYYVATQMVHHAGARNGISKIGFARTSFAVPEAPVLVSVEPFVDSLVIEWKPSERPNGEITHYQVTWRAVKPNLEKMAEISCRNERDRNTDDHKIKEMYQEDTSLDLKPSDDNSNSTTSTSLAMDILTGKAAAGETCSAIANCCECSATTTVSTTNQRSPSATSHSSQKPDHAATAAEQAAFENNVMDTVLVQSDKLRAKRSIENVNRVNEMLEKEEKQQEQKKKPPTLPRKPLIYKEQKSSKPSPTPIITTTTTTTVEPTTTTPRHFNVIYDITIDEDPKKPSETRQYGINITVDRLGGVYKYRIENLNHFTLYGLSVAACQDRSAREHHCSPIHRAGTTKITLPILEYDRVDNSTVRVEKGRNHRELLIKWHATENPNGGIRAYEVDLSPKNKGNPAKRCVPNYANWSSWEDGVYVSDLTHGFYIVQITPVSVFGTGQQIKVDTLDAQIIEPSIFTLPVIACIIFFILFIIGGIALSVYYYVQVHYGKKVKALADFMHMNPEYCVDNKYTADDWELDPAVVTIADQIGEGSFGKVFVGMGKNIQSMYGCTFGPCAIKMNISDAENAAENNMNYLMEANIMKNFKTSFIVKLYGVISTYNPAWVVMEMMELGNLRDYLRGKRDDEVFNEMDCNFYDIVPREKFSEWAAMICDGMAYLESLKFCHRDLAARNCMIDSHETVKIGDFGMARDLFYHDYYKPSGKRMMPVRWMSPESLKDGKFDSKSDVWSFGVVLYEMVTLGAQPYIGLSNDEVLNYIGMSRKVIRKPECCSDYWYKVMKMCWRYSPRDRPTFLQLVHLLSAEASEDFKEKSFVLTENQMAMEDTEPLDLEGIDIWDEPLETEKIPAVVGSDAAAAAAEESDATTEDPEARRNTDSIPMKPLKTGIPASQSALSVDAAVTKKSPDDEYQLMNHSRGPSDTEVRHYGGDGDYVERDVHNDVPTRRNTGASTSSYTGGPYCLSNRGGSNERAGFGEGLRLTDNMGSGHLNDESDYVEKDLSSMDTRRSTGASTASYGVPQQTNWSGTRGATYYANKQAAAAAQQQQALLNGRGDRLTQLPGTQNLPPARGRDEDYIETMPRNGVAGGGGGGRNQGSPSRNGNSAPNRGSFNGRSAFGENERLIEDTTEHPLQ